MNPYEPSDQKDFLSDDSSGSSVKETISVWQWLPAIGCTLLIFADIVFTGIAFWLGGFIGIFLLYAIIVFLCILAYVFLNTFFQESQEERHAYLRKKRKRLRRVKRNRTDIFHCVSSSSRLAQSANNPNVGLANASRGPDNQVHCEFALIPADAEVSVVEDAMRAVEFNAKREQWSNSGIKWSSHGAAYRKFKRGSQIASAFVTKAESDDNNRDTLRVIVIINNP